MTTEEREVRRKKRAEQKTGGKNAHICNMSTT